MVNELGQRGIRINQPLTKFSGVRCCKSDSLNAINLTDKLKQGCEVCCGLIRRRPINWSEIGIDVLTEQRDFTHAFRRKFTDLG